MSTGWTHLLRVVGGLVVISGLAGLGVYGPRELIMWVLTVIGAAIVASAKLLNIDVRLEAAEPHERSATPQRALSREQRERLQTLVSGDGVRVAEGTRRAAALGLVVSGGLLGGLLTRTWFVGTPPIMAVPAFVLGLALCYALSAWWRLRRAPIAPGLYCDGHHLLYATVDELVYRRLDGKLITKSASRRDDGIFALSLALRDQTIETITLVDPRAAQRLLELVDSPAPEEGEAVLEGPPAPSHLGGEAYRALDEPAHARDARIFEALERGARGAKALGSRNARRRAIVASAGALLSAALLLTINSLGEQSRFLARCAAEPGGMLGDKPYACRSYFERFDVHLLAGAARDRIAALHRARFDAARDTPNALRALITLDTRKIAGLDAERAAAISELYKIGGARRLRELYGLAQKRLRSRRCRGVPPKIKQALLEQLARARAGNKAVLAVIVRANTDATYRPIKLAPLYANARVHVDSPSGVFGTAKNARRARTIAVGVGRVLARLVGDGTLQTPARWRVDTSKSHLAISYTVTPDGSRLLTQRKSTLGAWTRASHYVGLRFSWTAELYHRGHRIFRFKRDNAPPRSLTVKTYGHLAAFIGASARSVYDRMVQLAIVRFIEQLGEALGHC